MITSSVPVATAPAAGQSDGMVMMLVAVLVLAVVGFVAWKYLGSDDGGSGGSGGNGGYGYGYGNGTTAFDWMNTNAPTYYPTAIPSQQPAMMTQPDQLDQPDQFAQPDQYQYAA